MFKSILFAVALTSGVGMPCAFADEVQPIEEKVEFKQENKKLVSYDDNQEQVSLTYEDLNTYTFKNLYNTLDNLGFDTIYFIWTDASFTYNSNDSIYDNTDIEYNIHFDITNYKLVNTSSNEWGQNVVIDMVNHNEGDYTSVKQAIELDIQANSQGNQPFMQPVLQELVSLLVSGITAFAGGIGTGVSTLVSDIFINNGQLSVFGAIICIFGGIALAIGLSRWVMNYLTSLGAKK